MPTSPCVLLVPSGRVHDPAIERALAEVSRRGCPVWRVREPDPPPDVRDRLVTDALTAGFDELLLVSPAVLFDPDDVDRLRSHAHSFVCGVYPLVAACAFACDFTPDTPAVTFGRGGGPTPVAACALGFALIRRAVFDAVLAAIPNTSGGGTAYFAPDPDAAPGPVPAGDAAFCRRALAAGFPVVADTAIRLWHVGPHRYGWEDVVGDRDRHDTLVFRPAPITAQTDSAVAQTEPTLPGSHPEPPRPRLRGPAAPLAVGFLRVKLYTFSYPANAASLEHTLRSVRESDWGEEPVVVMQPADWPRGRESGSRTYKMVLEAAAADGCDFALVLEDDVRVGRHLRHNVLTNPLVARDQCDYLGLFMPDLVADPWERAESHLGYRLAKPRYAGPNRGWERSRVWGSQGYVLSRRLVLAALDRWDRLREGQDTRVIGVCAEFGLPLWYTAPCLVEHAPLTSAFDTPEARAPDFDPDFRLAVGAGFQPPDAVPGWLSLAEAELLWRTATGRAVLELGTASGRSAVCLGQSARRVVSVDVADQSEAREWARRFGVLGRAEFVRGDAGEVCRGLAGPFGLIFIDTLHDAASVARDIACALPLLAPGGLLAFHDYPDPGWPDVRRVVDEHARRLSWRRVAQADFLGVFRTG